MIKNRTDAGKKLGERLVRITKEKEIIVLAIPRGGVVVGYEISKVLKCKFDIVIAKKITPPQNPEFAIGAITYDGTIFEGPYWDDFAKSVNLDEEILRKKNEVKRRLEKYRGKGDYELENKLVILVDDGVATGATMFVLLKWLAKKNASKVIVAVPVISARTYEELKSLTDDIIALEIPFEFASVGQFYEEFNEVTDEQVLSILNQTQR